jgi:membrane protease YdiL (CAAX protease family)
LGLYRSHPFFSELSLVSSAVVLSSLAAYFVLERLMGQSYLPLLGAEDLFLFLALTISLLGGSQGSLAYVVMVPVALLAFVEELLINGTLVWSGFILAFMGLVCLPVFALFFRNRDSNVSAALEVSALLFVTRLVLSPFPVSMIQSSVMVPIIYTLIIAALVIYIWVRRLPLEEVGLTRGSGRLPVQIVVGLLIGAVLGYVELDILRPPPISIGPSFPVNALYVIVTMVAFIGVTEELLYRGLVLSRLAKIMPRWQAVHITAVLFALFNIGWFNPLEVIFAYAAGVVFGYLMLKYNSIAAPITAHGACNVVLSLLALSL